MEGCTHPGSNTHPGVGVVEVVVIVAADVAAVVLLGGHNNYYSQRMDEGILKI